MSYTLELFPEDVHKLGYYMRIVSSNGQAIFKSGVYRDYNSSLSSAINFVNNSNTSMPIYKVSRGNRYLATRQGRNFLNKRDVNDRD